MSVAISEILFRGRMLRVVTTTQWFKTLSSSVLIVAVRIGNSVILPRLGFRPGLPAPGNTFIPALDFLWTVASLIFTNYTIGQPNRVTFVSVAGSPSL